MPAPNPAVEERDKRELPAGHVLLELGGICLFQLLLADPIAQKDVIVIHEHIRHFFHEMLPDFCILNSLLVSVLLDNVDNFAYFTEHP